ncbi:hypothetical protein A4X13_0g7081 [Tilletia indica]|uniref:Uncharacterized protein n=1 Tax=Tilletia indica TaxID=43049 RepID=A0A177T6T3_9BASI|nr:hypothetical protein A4X13_0g7081 [Tilletia indica]
MVMREDLDDNVLKTALDAGACPLPLPTSPHSSSSFSIFTNIRPADSSSLLPPYNRSNDSHRSWARSSFHLWRFTDYLLDSLSCFQKDLSDPLFLVFVHFVELHKQALIHHHTLRPYDPFTAGTGYDPKELSKYRHPEVTEIHTPPFSIAELVLAARDCSNRQETIQVLEERVLTSEDKVRRLRICGADASEIHAAQQLLTVHRASLITYLGSMTTTSSALDSSVIQHFNADNGLGIGAGVVATAAISSAPLPIPDQDCEDSIVTVASISDTSYALFKSSPSSASAAPLPAKSITSAQPGSTAPVINDAEYLPDDQFTTIPESSVLPTTGSETLDAHTVRPNAPPDAQGTSVLTSVLPTAPHSLQSDVTVGILPRQDHTWQREESSASVPLDRFASSAFGVGRYAEAYNLSRATRICGADAGTADDDEHSANSVADECSSSLGSSTDDTVSTVASSHASHEHEPSKTSKSVHIRTSSPPRLVWADVTDDDTPKAITKISDVATSSAHDRTTGWRVSRPSRSSRCPPRDSSLSIVLARVLAALDEARLFAATERSQQKHSANSNGIGKSRASSLLLSANIALERVQAALSVMHAPSALLHPSGLVSLPIPVSPYKLFPVRDLPLFSSLLPPDITSRYSVSDGYSFPNLAFVTTLTLCATSSSLSATPYCISCSRWPSMLIK